LKIIKEHINEKFTQESDPIYDIGIGDFATWDNLRVGDILRIKKPILISDGSENSYLVINQIDRIGHTNISIYYDYYLNIYNLLQNEISHSSGWELSKDFFEEHFEPMRPWQLDTDLEDDE